MQIILIRVWNDIASTIVQVLKIFLSGCGRWRGYGGEGDTLVVFVNDGVFEAGRVFQRTPFTIV